MKMKGNQGFSLVELMVVVGIIGILATVAVPRMQTFMAKAKTAEAKTNLSHIFTLQQSYYAEQPVATYGTLAQIGFVTPATARYGYSDVTTTAAAFTSRAWANVNLCTGVAGGSHDQWTIDQNRTLTNTIRGWGC